MTRIFPASAAVLRRHEPKACAMRFSWGFLSLLLALVVAAGIGFVVWTMTGGHVFLFPLVLIFGAPLIPLFGRRKTG